MNKQIIAIIVLSVLLVSVVSYICIDNYQEKQQKEQLSIYQQGMQAGYEQAIVQLVQQALTCQPVPVKVQNQTINMIAVECLQVPEEK